MRYMICALPFLALLPRHEERLLIHRFNNQKNILSGNKLKNLFEEQRKSDPNGPPQAFICKDHANSIHILLPNW